MTTKNQTFSDQMWRIFVSVKFTIVLLTIWLFGSIAGTVILQNGNPAQYVELYDAKWADLMLNFGLFDVYHSTWYSLVLLLLMLNIIACSINTTKSKMALAFVQPKKKALPGGGKNFFSYEQRLGSNNDITEKLKTALATYFPKLDIDEENDSVKIFAHKQAYSHFMVYVVHLSLVIIILGGVISATFGFEGIMEIPDGSERNYIFKKTDMGYVEQTLPFTVKCENFKFEKFENGMPKDYISTLSIIENDKLIFTQRIEVNDPLSYLNINFYQSTYSQLAAFTVSNKAGQEERLLIAPGEKLTLNKLGVIVMLENFYPGDSRFPMNASLLLGTSENDVSRVSVVTNKKTNSANQKGSDFLVQFSSNEPKYLTGLMVVSDPGVWFVWLGCFLMTIGLYLTFYTAHRRLQINITNNTFTLKAITNRNVIAYKRDINKILASIGLDNNEVSTNDK